MTELDQIWSQALADAAAKAADAGRGEIAAYLRLRAANDAIRSEGVRWLFDTLIEMVTQNEIPGVSVEREAPHRFPRGNSHLVGSLVRVRQGVRCMTVEAGWTRTPKDGIMHKGALAGANICHFGIKRANAELVLAYMGDLPVWHFETDDGARRPFLIKDLDDHLRTFLDL